MKLCKKCIMLYSRMNFVSLCPLSSWLKGAAEFFPLCKFSRVVQTYVIKSWNSPNCSYAVWHLSGCRSLFAIRVGNVCRCYYVKNYYWEYIQHFGKCVRCTSSCSQRSSHINSLNLTNIRKWGKTLVSWLTSIYQRAIIKFHQFMNLLLNSAKYY